MDDGSSAWRFSPASGALSSRADYDLGKQVQRKGEAQAVLTEGSDWREGRRRGVVGVNLAAELDGAWRRGRRGAFPGAGSAGGVRAGPAKVIQGPNKSGGHRR